MRRGFTLLELIVVIIIIGILATLGITQYGRLTERGRLSEARTVLGQLRTAQEAYRQEYGNYTATLDQLALSNIPTAAAPSTAYYFTYACVVGGTCTATRATSGTTSKSPGGFAAYTVTVDIMGGNFTGNTAGYY